LSPRGAAPAAAALESRLALALALATLAFWWPQRAFFPLPNNDFATFEAVARSFARLELPTTFQRLPLLPAAMALLASALPGKHALLHAALALNAAFALATLPLLQRVAAGCLPRGSLLVPVLFAGTAQLHGQGLQPLVEPSLGFFVVLAFALFQRRSPWQYAAAAAAALSRYEAVLLLPLFAAWNAFEDRRAARRHALAAALGALPFALWAAAGAVRGSGAAFYAADMERMGFSPAPHVLATLLKESFRGLWMNAPGPDVPVFLAAASAPAALGALVLLRRVPRESTALLAYLAGTLAVIVLLGIDKARYLYPVLWIPLLFFAAGLLAALRFAAPRLAALPWPALAAVLAAALALGTLFASDGLGELARAPHDVVPLAADLAYAAVLAALAAAALAVALAGTPGATPHAAGTAFVAGLAVVLPLLLGGMTGRAAEQRKIRFANESVVVSAAWLEAHLGPDERALVMHRQHYLFLTGLEPDRFVGFYDLEAQDVGALAAEMRARGLTHVVATWRKPVAQAIDQVYERKFKWFLVDPFARGEPVPGFEHLAALPLPEHLRQPPVQVYRLARGAP
jgi:hypothetical protein